MAALIAEYTTMFGELATVEFADKALLFKLNNGNRGLIKNEINGVRPAFVTESSDPPDGSLQVGWLLDSGVITTMRSTDTGKTWQAET